MQKVRITSTDGRSIVVDDTPQLRKDLMKGLALRDYVSLKMNGDHEYAREFLQNAKEKLNITEQDIAAWNRSNEHLGPEFRIEP